MTPCEHCKHPLPPSVVRCSHCAMPGSFPNVRAAAADDEKTSLRVRYERAIEDAIARKCDNEVQELETIASNTCAVIARSESEVFRLATSDRQLYASYYEINESGSRIPDGEKWDVLRSVADVSWFPNYHKEIRFGALSSDGVGLSNYGEYSMVLADHMIAHRATVSEENTTLFMKHHNIASDKAHELPSGYRACWTDRAKLCVAKLASRVEIGATSSSLKGLLITQGGTTADDDFVEVHIWGTFTVRSLKRIIVHRKKGRPALTKIRALRYRLEKFQVPLEERP